MSRIYSFPPITSPGMRVLVLGSMPGGMSLREYPKRVEKLRAHGIGVWDVLESCQRPNSSLDSAITHMQANDFAKLFAQHPALTHVFFNGGKAEEAYRRFVLKSLPETYGYLRYTRLPSTSPAHAGMPYSEKLSRWNQLLEPLAQPVNYVRRGR